MTGLLIFLTIVLIVLVLFQVARTVDLIGELKTSTKEGEIDDNTNNFQGYMMLLLGVFTIGILFWGFAHFKDRFLPPSASEHGAVINNLFYSTTIITGIVYVLTNFALFVFAFLFRRRKGYRSATHISHNNQLELIWTAIPAVVLTFLVVLGLRAWFQITGPASEDALVFEATGQQFFWTVRYPGPDGKLGERNFNLISSTNPLGIVTKEYTEHKKVELAKAIARLEERQEMIPQLMEPLKLMIDKSPNKYQVDSAKLSLKDLKKELKKIPAQIDNREDHMDRIHSIFTDEYFADNKELIQNGYDDFLPSEIHLPVDKEILVKIQALDVLHNFYLPHFTVKMDAVPGIPTQFKFKPTITTVEMREILSENPEWQVIKAGEEKPRFENFNYEVACAELCGQGHNSMRYQLVIETQEEYDYWISQQLRYYDLVKETLLSRNDLMDNERALTLYDGVKTVTQHSNEEH